MEAISSSRAHGNNLREPIADNDLVEIEQWLLGETITEFETSPSTETDEFEVAPQPAPAPAPVPNPPPPASPPAVPRRSFARRLTGWAFRMLRRTVALVLLLLAVWFWALPFFFPVTSRAVVNARTVQIRAPIGGDVTALSVEVGNSVVAGDPVLRITGRNVDISHLTTARTRQSELVARRARLAAELEITTTASRTAQEELERYKKAMAGYLNTTGQEGRVRVKMAELELQAVDRRAERARKLVDRGGGAVADRDDTRDAAAVAKAKIDLERAGLGRTEAELEALDKELFVARDIPLLQLQTRDLAIKLRRLPADLAEVDEMLKTAAAAVDAEHKRVRGLSESSVHAPVSGIVWKRPGGLSQVVDRNETVFDIADQKTIFVEAIVHQRHLTSVTAGCKATVCVTGGQTLTGRVQAVRTPDPSEAGQGYAVSLSDGDPRQVKVIIQLDGPVANAVLVGRHARVLITGAEPTAVEAWVDWLFTRMRF